MAAKKLATKKKATAKKAVSKKVASKKVASKKVASKKRATKKTATATASPAGGMAPSKSEMLNHIVAETALSRKEVSAVIDSLTNYVGDCLTSRKYGMFRMPGLFKISVKKVPAKKAGYFVNPFDKDAPPAYREAKPASKRVRVVALKALKDIVN
jgi:hypothetical protein